MGTIAHDGSLRPSSRFPVGYEARLGPYRPRDLQHNVRRMFAMMHAWGDGITVNQSCGLHVHLDMTRIDGNTRTKVISRWLLYEPLLLACVSGSRANNQYCRNLGHFAPNLGGMNGPMLITNEGRQDLEAGTLGRYLALNPNSYQRHTTYEVRLAPGTVNARRASEWAYIVARTLNRFCERPVLDIEIETAQSQYTGAFDTDKLVAAFKTVVQDDLLINLLSQFQRRQSRATRYLSYPTARSGYLQRRGIIIQRGFYIV